MKHIAKITTPAKAAVEHPGLYDSISGFLKDPAGVVTGHVNAIIAKAD